MTPRERVLEVLKMPWRPDPDPYAPGRREFLLHEELESRLEQAITAAVEEERAHRLAHVKFAIEHEREMCAELARKVRLGSSNETVHQTSIDIEALILARTTASAHQPSQWRNNMYKTEDIDKLEAGRNLDRLVAVKVMRWHTDYHLGFNHWFDSNNQPRELITRFEPSTDIADAWAVVEKLAKRETHITVEFYHGDWHCYSHHDPIASNEIMAWARTAPLAICMAALKAVASEQQPHRTWNSDEWAIGKPVIFNPAILEPQQPEEEGK